VKYFLEKGVHFTAGAFFEFAQAKVMLVAKEVVAQEWVVNETLKHHVQVACLAEIEETSTTWERMNYETEVKGT
jgi:hypothetical protein